MKKIKTCKICGREIRAKGLCSNHYGQLQQYGKIKTLSEKPSLRKYRICKIKDCGHEHFAKGYCRKHYTNWLRCGKPLGINKGIKFWGKFVKCHICKKAIYRTPFRLKKQKYHFCSNKCYSIFHSKMFQGKNNPLWKGGISDYYKHGLMKKMRLKKLQRVKGKCEICGKKAVGIHHKDNGKRNHSLKNLIAVCRRCHGILHQGRKAKTSKFIRLYGMNLEDLSKKLGCSSAPIYNWHKKGKLKNILTKLHHFTYTNNAMLREQITER